MKVKMKAIVSIRSTLVAILVASAGLAHATPTLNYRVRVEELRDQRLFVTLTLTGCEGESILLHGVPSYMDNPVADPRRRTIRKLRARDESGAALQVDSEPVSGEKRIYRIATPAAGPIVVDYELNIEFQESRQTKDYPVQVPFMDRRRAWLAGNYIFCHPELSPDAATAMRIPIAVAVAFDLPADIPLHGLPAAGVELRNLYELLSLQFGLGQFVSEDLGLVAPSVKLLYRNEKEFDADEQAALRGWTRSTVETLTHFFGGAPFPQQNFYYFRNDNSGGLEGAYTCQAYVDHHVRIEDPPGEQLRHFLMIALHECFHSWVPIGLFASGDPWFKEGVTSYYGNVLSIRLGFYELADFMTELPRYGVLLESNPLLGQVPLTDPRIWYKEYDGEDWRHLTYSRGQAVALLLDVLIREDSGNRHSLDDVLRALYRDFARDDFTHAEFQATIASSTGFDAGPFFAEYVSGLRVPSLAEVEGAMAAADSLGVFAFGSE